MAFKKLVILLPCYSLDDFPQYHQGADAESLLACWTSLWHPSLIATSRQMPSWHRADVLMDDFENCLVVVPTVSEPELAEGTSEKADQANACMITGMHDRREIVQRALESIEEDSHGVDPDLVADFHALGYCFLQVELLTRQMRYSTNLEEDQFRDHLVSAACAAVQNERKRVQDSLGKCFDVLAQERDHYYPVDAHVIDLILVAPTTMGAGLRAELESAESANVLVPVRLLHQMANRHPESLTALKQAMDRDAVCLVSGPRSELAFSLLSCESVIDELSRGRDQIYQLIGKHCDVYGSRRYSLNPLIPQILDKFGYCGLFHAVFEGGRYPESNQAKTRWEGVDGTAMDAVMRMPLDATRPETFLNLSQSFADSMESDYVATVVMAHWAGHSTIWQEDLQRCCRYTSALGKLTSLHEFFSQADHTGHQDKFDVDRYRAADLTDDVRTGREDPISRYVTYWKRRVHLESVKACQSFAVLLADNPAPANNTDEPTHLLNQALPRSELRDPRNAIGNDIDRQLAAMISMGVKDLQQAVSESSEWNDPGWLIVNPFSFVQRLSWSCEHESKTFNERNPVYAVGDGEGRNQIVVDVPACGYVFLPESNQEGAARRKDETSLVEDNVLRNEFFEATIDDASGALRSIYDFHSRGNRLSQLLAFRHPSNDDPSRWTYTSMKCESIDTTVANRACGEIMTTGLLIRENGDNVAKFKQTYRVWRGIRVLQIDIELDPMELPGENPWNSYYACRFAWADASAEMHRSVNCTSQPTDASRFESPLFVDLQTESTRTTILAGGHPYHRKSGPRNLDTLLSVKGESATRFQLGIGVDLRNPLHDAYSFLAPQMILKTTGPRRGNSGWLFHIDARSVIATSWEPILIPAESESPGRYQAKGVRVRLLETMGRSGPVTLTTFRPLRSAREVDFTGRVLAECPIVDGKVRWEARAYQWTQIEACW